MCGSLFSNPSLGIASFSRYSIKIRLLLFNDNSVITSLVLEQAGIVGLVGYKIKGKVKGTN